MSETVTSSSTRLVDGAELPVAGRWRIDPGHAEVGFLGRHLVFTKVRGRFRGVEGSVNIAENPNDTTVEVKIDMASVESGNSTRDDHLRSADLFDVERFPIATFKGQAREWVGGEGKLVGELTIREIARRIELEVSYIGAITDPWGGERAIFSASATLNREDWGITWNMPLAGGGLLVSKQIQIELELETIREP